MPLLFTTDAAHGGRWTSLNAGGREWLWRRQGVGRERVSPGDAFVDAGGLEECVPTVRGTPDHGDVWSRAWSRHGDTERVACKAFTLARTVRATADGVRADYTLVADPGYRFVWAAHALLDLSEGAELRARAGTPTRVFPEASSLLDAPWPNGAAWVEGNWPAPGGLRLDRFGPDDGTAVGAVLTCGRACVHDGADRLSLAVEAEGQPVSIALWRNLGGFPPPDPYRSTGVEPMLGRTFDLADAGPGDAAQVPASGEVHWRLTLTASCICPRPSGCCSAGGSSGRIRPGARHK
ncbi:hypothetical protein [Streptomyces sp. LUP47B]|uniref:hypothetical protein n=1 Tax=Streptomyces sp. LUP47B TaxID=1890286 RepID=UPI000B25E4D5|nr:hypothetical protein [Streptomyces sp. LUP47B]